MRSFMGRSSLERTEQAARSEDDRDRCRAPRGRVKRAMREANAASVGLSGAVGTRLDVGWSAIHRAAARSRGAVERHALNAAAEQLSLLGCERARIDAHPAYLG